jgi:NADPH:quinone reductase-like Zn-dependent oxidoreductase
VVEHGAIRPGSVVVTQGTGGVSLFALQFSKRLGARVVATTSSEAKAQKLAELGADAIVNYRREPDWTKRARELAGGPVDLVVEVGGADTLDASLRLVRPGGTIALVGVLSGAKASVTLPLAVFAGCAACGAYGVLITRQSSRSGRRCCGSSRTCSVATNHNLLVAW